MKPTQQRPGHYWKSDDPADLSFNEAGSQAPTTVRCFNMQDHLNRGESRDVPVEGLQFLAAGHFGEPRSSGITSDIRWTGSSYRYGIYRNPFGLYKSGIVLLECHGGGMVGYAFDNIVAGETWEHITKRFSSEMVWNLCHQVAAAYRAARDAERQLQHRAFAEGRLRKRKRSNRIYVEVTPTAETENTSRTQLPLIAGLSQ